ncbi:diguanylate cyclase [Thermosynechococcus sichuanensis E542]|uniref:Diguanylate cyclase n=1 Tax=Thermosynechococcus sichuanensis E542 TaxID=2016101 RepID=A0A3B7M990_9CYAN|nr:diguanylate cyclase [Thermosynechococcus vestitus]AXY67203.1 diguanylate cyclase [Thermosynechococcus vestitus E542]
MAILLYHDDVATAARLVSILTTADHRVDVVARPEDLWGLLASRRYHLLIVDESHLGTAVEVFCHQVRDRGFQEPILVLTRTNLPTQPESQVIYYHYPCSPAALLEIVQQLLSAIATSKPDNNNDSGLPLVLHIDNDAELIRSLEEHSADGGFRYVAMDSWPLVKTFLEECWPNAVILNPEVMPDAVTTREFLQQLRQHRPPIPALVFTAHDTWRDRLAAIRLGSRMTLSKPVDVERLLQTLEQLLQPQEITSASILTVDDDAVTLTILKRLLEPWGMSVTSLQDPDQFWDVLEATNPELVILDVQMPGINGLELCQVVRNDPRWNQLPILFLTATTDPALVTQLFAAGADDFVNKPIVGPELMTRIINRLERTRLLKRLAEVDPLTGLSNRRKATEDIERFLTLASRQQQTLCIAVLDLDHFKRINDTYGHDVGDQVLVTTARLLRQSLRMEDVVARWGGEEFLIALYDISLDVAKHRLAICLQRLRNHTFHAPNHDSFKVSFSAGLSQFPTHGQSLLQLVKVADDALYAAKAAGRSQIVIAPQEAAPEFANASSPAE